MYDMLHYDGFYSFFATYKCFICLVAIEFMRKLKTCRRAHICLHTFNKFPFKPIRFHNFKLKLRVSHINNYKVVEFLVKIPTQM